MLIRMMGDSGVSETEEHYEKLSARKNLQGKFS